MARPSGNGLGLGNGAGPLPGNGKDLEQELGRFDQSFSADEISTKITLIGLVAASHSNDGLLTYSVVVRGEDGAFAIDAENRAIAVPDSTLGDYASVLARLLPVMDPAGPDHRS